MSLARIEHVDQTAVLKTLNLNPADPHTQALLLICDRYRLDPLLKHIVLIDGRPYVTRDGYLQIAHSTDVFDGIEVLEEGETDTHWWARVSVHRQDMGRPFTYRGRYSKKASNARYGPEMAVKCAEVASLRRAFNVTGIGAADERWDDDDVPDVGPVTLPAKDAKEQLLAAAGDDKTAATDAWNAAGLQGRRTVTRDDLSAAFDALTVGELDELPEPDTEPTTGSPEQPKLAPDAA